MPKSRSVPLKPRGWLQRVHLLASLWLGLFLLVVTTSGCVALYRDELIRLGHPALFRVTPGPAVGFDAALTAVRAAYPREQIQDVFRPNKFGQIYGIYLGKDYSRIALVDPGSGRLNGVLNPDATWPGWITHLHTSLFGEKLPFHYPKGFPTWLATLIGEHLGELVLKTVGLALLVMVLTGAVLWWPGLTRLATAFRLRLGKNAYLRHLDWHRLLGLLSLPMLFVWAVTGLNFYEPYRGWIGRAWSAVTLSRAPAEAPEVKSVPGGGPAISSARAVRLALAEVPGGHVTSVHVPGAADPSGAADLWLMRGHDPYTYNIWPGSIEVKLDQYSGRVLDNSLRRDAGAAAGVYTNWFGSLHMGYAVNGWWRLAWLAFGALPLVLAVTGVAMWWHKRRARRRSPATRRAPTASPLQQAERP